MEGLNTERHQFYIAVKLPFWIQAVISAIGVNL
jgi:hypothetical protein